MDHNQILSLYEYNYWANHCVLDKAGELDPELWSAPAEVSFGSLRETLTHVLSTEWIWRQRIQEGVSPAGFPLEITFPTVEPMVEYWLQEERQMQDFLKDLSVEDYSRVVHYKNTKGISYSNPLWQILLHLVNHGTQFRSEAAVILTMYGRSPGDLDYILFLRQNK
jgi:uncharacterized damage-inducible protein DinB